MLLPQLRHLCSSAAVGDVAAGITGRGIACMLRAARIHGFEAISDLLMEPAAAARAAREFWGGECGVAPVGLAPLAEEPLAECDR